jgi:hypothetical protein
MAIMWTIGMTIYTDFEKWINSNKTGFLRV